MAERMSYSERITAFLEENHTESYSADNVATALGLKFSSVASILSRLVREGRIEKRGFSAYGAKLMRVDLALKNGDEITHVVEVKIPGEGKAEETAEAVS